MSTCLSNVASLEAAAAEMVRNLSAAGISQVDSLAHHGDTNMLRATLSAHCLSNRGATLQIGVIGGSMTSGSMNCHSMMHVPCQGQFKPRGLRWSDVLQKELSAVLPCRVKVVNRALSASPMSVALSVKVRESLVSPLDAIIIEDWTINDYYATPSNAGSHARGMVAAAMELLIRRSRSMPARPAFIHMESITRPQLANCSHAAIDDAHWPAAVHYGVPVVSFPRAICEASREPSGKLAFPYDTRFWRAGCKGLDSVEPRHGPCAVHPGPTTHRFYAQLLASLLLSHASVACAAPLAKIQMAVPLPPTLMPGPELDMMQGCLRTQSSVDASGGCGTQVALTGARLHLTGGWRCYEDVPGKPGWIANATQATLEFTVRVNAHPGRVTISFLRSYTRMAKILVGIDGHYSEEEGAEILDGMWESKTSQLDFAVLNATKLMAGRRRLSTSVHHPTSITLGFRVMTPGKFKVVALQTC